MGVAVYPRLSELLRARNLTLAELECQIEQRYGLSIAPEILSHVATWGAGRSTVWTALLTRRGGLLHITAGCVILDWRGALLVAGRHQADPGHQAS